LESVKLPARKYVVDNTGSGWQIVQSLLVISSPHLQVVHTTFPKLSICGNLLSEQQEISDEFYLYYIHSDKIAKNEFFFVFLELILLY
jgi:hypothetical protein